MKKKVLGYYDYTVILTYCGMLFAVFGIFRVINQEYWEAIFCLMLAGICDMFDGAVASTKVRTVSEKRFGIQIDSLSDLVSFGVLPGIFVYMVSCKNALIGLVSALFILCALIRLAYFNVLEEERQSQTLEKRKSYMGLPVTTVAILLPIVYILYDCRVLKSIVCFPILLILLGAGFLSRVEIKKPGVIGKICIIILGIFEVLGMVIFYGMGFNMKHSLILSFLYRTTLGRMLLKLLVQPKVSQMAGNILSSGISKCLVPYYIRKYKIDMSDIEIPQGGFLSFNDFFIRKRNALCLDLTYGHLISPCDGLLTHVRINNDVIFEIKNTKYSLRDLLNDKELANIFEGGMALILRLTPADYHRYCYPATGEIILSKKIQGKLHCVRPIALRTVPVYIQNSREYQVIKTEQFGMMIQMEIGALLVGKIENYIRPLEKKYIQVGEEKGYFEFGGSTIILLFQKDAICMNGSLYKKNNNHAEIRVRMGEFIAQINQERRGYNE